MSGAPQEVRGAFQPFGGIVGSVVGAAAALAAMCALGASAARAAEAKAPVERAVPSARVRTRRIVAGSQGRFCYDLEWIISRPGAYARASFCLTPARGANWLPRPLSES